MTAVAVIGAGAMGAGIGLRLAEGGAAVWTDLDGRGELSRRRAAEAGMEAVGLDRIAEADLVVSIVPPGAAVAVAERLAPALARGIRKPVFVDANAISPATMAEVAAALAETGCGVVDACIIGAPPKPRGLSPAFYVCGDPGGLTAPLACHGLDLKVLDAPSGTASALKMSYAICTKAATALGAAMLLAAARNGVADALRGELARSQPELLEHFSRSMPDMMPKAYRWVAEMREIGTFLGPGDPAALMLEGAARLYERLAADEAGPRDLCRTLLDAAIAPD